MASEAFSVAMPESAAAPSATRLVPTGSPQAAQCGMLTWQGVTVTVKDKAGHERQILKNAQVRPLLKLSAPARLCAANAHTHSRVCDIRVQGVAAPGELLAIMGARSDADCA